MSREEDIVVDEASEDSEPVAEAEATPPAPDAGSAEVPGEPGEEWIEEYEAETKQRPKRKIPHLKAIIATVVIVIILVVWTLISPQVLPESGGSYLQNPEYANLGSEVGELDIWWLFDAIHVADTSWGVSISGDRNASVGEPATFDVLVTKVREEMKNGWFKGTSIELKKVTMYTEDDDIVGSMVSKSEESFGTVGEVEATFDSAGNYSCHLMVEFTIYGKMVIGYLPVKVLRMEAYLSEDIVVT